MLLFIGYPLEYSPSEGVRKSILASVHDDQKKLVTLDSFIVGVDVTGTGKDADSFELLDDVKLFKCTGLSLSSETVSVRS